MNIGCHLSFSKGYEAMGREALRLGADCFQFFSRNPRGGAARPFDAGDALALEKIAEENSFGPLLVHAPYTFNPCSADAGLRKFALEAMKEDLSRLGAFKGALYNFHPGSHVGQGVKRGVELSARLLSEVCSGNFSAKILVETMSGKGSEIGSTFGGSPKFWRSPEPMRACALTLATHTPPATTSCGISTERSGSSTE